MGKQVLLRLFLIVVAVAGLLALGVGLGRPWSPSSKSNTQPDRNAIQIPTQAFFTSRLLPSDKSRGAALKGFEARYGGLDFNLGAEDHVRTSFRTIRTLQSGLIFDSKSVLEWERFNDGTGHADLHVEGPGTSRRDFRLDFVGDKPTTLTATLDKKKVINETHNLHALPVIIGDLNIQDHFDLVSSVRDRRYKVLGELRLLNARPQLVLSVDLAQPPPKQQDQSSEQDDDLDLSAASALIMVDAESSELRSVRFFEADGTLIRTYSDFGAISQINNLPFNYFRIDSVRSGNSTVIIIDNMEIE